jgi:hypothetical protein
MAFGYSHPHNPFASRTVALIMAIHSRVPLDPALYAVGTPDEAGNPEVAWSAIWAGAATAIAFSLILLMLGSGLGFAAISPWPGVGPTPTTFTIAAGIWLIITQWMSSAVGGYMAGRLRHRWLSLHNDEVFFRDTAHGLVTWATSTIIVVAVGVLSVALTSYAAEPVDPSITREAADAARKVAASFALFSSIALLIGAFIGCVGAVIGGRLHDRHP